MSGFSKLVVRTDACLGHMENIKFSVDIFLIGGVGALAPEIVRLYSIRTNPQFNWSWFYLIMSILFLMLGGLVACILPATTYYGAFYAGVSTPVLVNTIAKETEKRRDTNNQSQTSDSSESAEPSIIFPKRDKISQLFYNYWQALG